MRPPASAGGASRATALSALLFLAAAAVLAMRLVVHEPSSLTGEARATSSRVAAIEHQLVGRMVPKTRLGSSGAIRLDSVDFKAAGLHLVGLFRSDCEVCQRLRPTWIRLAREHPDVRAWAITMQGRNVGTALFEAPELPVWHSPSIAEYRRTVGTAEVVPVTMLLSSGGRVLFARIGMLANADLVELEASLRLQLPAEADLIARPP